MYNWCHGPSCHTVHTLSRIRGSKGNNGYPAGIWQYFCNQACLMDFMNNYAQAVTAIAPRREPLETPIKDPKKETTEHRWGRYNNWTIEKKVG